MKVYSGAPKKFPCPKNNDQIRPLDNVKKRLADDKILLLIYTFARGVRSFLLSFLAGFPADRVAASSNNVKGVL